MGYRPTRPICGTSQVNRSDDEAGEENAVRALRAHLVATDGTGTVPDTAVRRAGPWTSPSTW